MNFIFVLLLVTSLFYNSNLEGRWKLIDFTGFTTMVGSDAFKKLSEEKKLDAIQGMEFVLNNTFYSFQKDSIFFTNAGPDFSVSEKKGKFLLKSDTLIVFESGKVNPIKFFISSVNDSNLKLRFVRKGGELGPTEMTFERVD
ncbi:hypothetical protein OU792_04200 [Algoriphagus sp. NF]|jgi:hypothetical protein|uniref:Lipocalin-like domain-containing protein n=1 Tax=Algoriphagus marincola TaxID=264027 RepID=A0ABS7N555_9BACT|nr:MULTISPECIES: hypothetical protein [Algoriphagus]MBY5951466.1 hypothetical protein [Algoriphagus marincola]MDE0559174.1 hypothetical protein [Algoriphagus sp. NF]